MPASSQRASKAAAGLISRTRLATLGLATFGLATFGLSCGAAAEDAQPCSGTLCDLYYKANGGPPPASNGASAQASNGGATQLPPGATPLTVPSLPSAGGIMNIFRSGSSQDQAAQQSPAGATGAQPPASSFVHLGGGGLIGGNSEPCTGTLCDLYHGVAGGGPSASPATPAPSNAAAAPSNTLSASSSYVPPREAAVAQAPVDPAIVAQAAQRRRMYEAARDARARCHNPSDPWHCMR